MQLGNYVCLEYDNVFLPIESQMVIAESKKERKRTGTKSVAIATSKYAPCDVFPRVHYYCQDSVALPYYLQRYSSLRVLAPYWNNL